MDTVFVKSNSGGTYAWGPAAQIRGEEPVERLASLRLGSNRWEELMEFSDPDGLISLVLSEWSAERGDFISRCLDVVVAESEDGAKIESLVKKLVKWMELRPHARKHAESFKRNVPNGGMIDAATFERSLLPLVKMLRSAQSQTSEAERWIADFLRCSIGRKSGIKGLASWHAFTFYNVDHDKLQRKFPDAYAATVVERTSRRLIIN